MEFEEWLTDAAGEVVAHVERHGLGCTWTEARDRLLIEAGRGPYQLMIPIDAEEAEEHEQGFVTESGEHLVSLSNGRGWRHQEFVEAAACTHLHWHGMPYHPTDPAHSMIGIAIPWMLAAEVVQRLNFLLVACLGAPTEHEAANIDLAAIARVATCLAADIGDEVEYVVDQRGLGDELIESSDCILSPASRVFAAAKLLSDGAVVASAVLAEDVEWMHAARSRDTLRDPAHIECCVRSLLWWLGADWTTAPAAGRRS
jgi:hypothetical protein